MGSLRRRTRIVQSKAYRRKAPIGSGLDQRASEKSSSRKLSLQVYGYWYVSGMRIDLLYFEGCPNYRAAQHDLKQALLEEDIQCHIQLIAVNTNEEAQRVQFPGSPTIRVNGSDLFPAAERQGWGRGCRMYTTPEGLRGTPTKGMLREALRRQVGLPPSRNYR